MWESEGSSVMGCHVWNLLFANVLLDNSAKLETGLLSVDFVRVESSLGVEKDSEELISFFSGVLNFIQGSSVSLLYFLGCLWDLGQSLDLRLLHNLLVLLAVLRHLLVF